MWYGEQSYDKESGQLYLHSQRSNREIKYTPGN